MRTARVPQAQSPTDKGECRYCGGQYVLSVKTGMIRRHVPPGSVTQTRCEGSGRPPARP